MEIKKQAFLAEFLRGDKKILTTHEDHSKNDNLLGKGL
jgi:hypothetical protein